MKCNWCQELAIKSHTIPACIYRAAQARYGKHGLRSWLVPNREVQDLQKKPLLCARCDNSFSDAEEKFCRLLYQPLLRDVQHLTYDNWLLQVAMSIACKRLITALPQLSGLNPELIKQAEKALLAWKGFWLNPTSIAEEHGCHHFIPTNFIAKSDLSEIEFVMLKTTYASTVITTQDESNLLVWTAIPGAMFLTIVPGKTDATLSEFQINEVGSIDKNRQIPMTLIRSWLDSWITDGYEVAKTISPTQQDRIRAAKTPIEIFS